MANQTPAADAVDKAHERLIAFVDERRRSVSLVRLLSAICAALEEIRVARIEPSRPLIFRCDTCGQRFPPDGDPEQAPTNTRATRKRRPAATS